MVYDRYRFDIVEVPLAVEESGENLEGRRAGSRGRTSSKSRGFSLGRDTLSKSPITMARRSTGGQGSLTGP